MQCGLHVVPPLSTAREHAEGLLSALRHMMVVVVFATETQNHLYRSSSVRALLAKALPVAVSVVFPAAAVAAVEVKLLRAANRRAWDRLASAVSRLVTGKGKDRKKLKQPTCCCASKKVLRISNGFSLGGRDKPK